ncbi:uncharacterized protein LOC110905026 isoform X2 [Helianthus annuus]|uniref:uncharacterized protein LOC110905026 isoform X2 n=1 Tax=Helianthus annuus TaxID=4232 RepID=UPI000B8F46C8|nr:uncharacterized protein LOC110905026 isoform X2 [Helianthus annuus]
MRRSFGAMGGGGGGMMKTVHRAVRAGSGTGDPFSHSTTNHNSPTYRPSSTDNKNNNSNTLSFSSNHHPYPSSYINQYDDFVFSTVPSMDEVHHAIDSLQQVLNPPAISHESGWEFDWIEPSTILIFQKMVMSIASDKSVWEAVMNNEAVRELRDSFYEANKSILGDEVESSDDRAPVPDVLQWILINTKAKLMEIVKKTTEMVNRMLFQSPGNGKAKDEDGVETEPFGKKVTSSFFLSIMVLMIIVVTRSCKY